MYIAAFDGSRVYQYTLSTAWDVSTATYDSVDFYSGNGRTNLTDIHFSSDGTKMYLASYDSPASIYQYTLSTAWDLSTASYASKSANVSANTTFPTGVAFSADGTKMYTGGPSSPPTTVFQYTLSTAWDTSTASYDSKSYTLADSSDFMWVSDLSSDGTSLYGGAGNDGIVILTLNTAYDISSVSAEAYFNLGGLYFAGADKRQDADVLYGVAGSSIHEITTALLTQTLDLSTGSYFSFTPSGATTVSFTNAPASGKAVGFAVEINGDGSAITWPSSVKWPSGVAPTATASKEVYAFVTTDGGTSYYGKLAGSDIA